MRIIGVTTLVLITGVGGVALELVGWGFSPGIRAAPFSLSTVVNPANVLMMSEPALLTALGMGLLGSAAMMRRHRQNRS